MNAQFNQINTIEELDKVFDQSNEKPVMLFKHSVTCPISAGVYEVVRNVEGEVNIVVVQSARDISNEIAARTGIRHESPQAIVIKNGAPVYHASHYDITSQDVNEKLEVKS